MIVVSLYFYVLISKNMLKFYFINCGLGTACTGSKRDNTR